MRSLGVAAVLAVPFTLFGCAATETAEAPADSPRPIAEPTEQSAPADPVAQLAEIMTGTFDSSAQSEGDPENFFNIRLVMLPVWAGRDDGPWLYVEQAAASALDRPYRQRVYRLVATADGVRSDVYTINGDPQRYAGCWDGSCLSDIGPGDLTLREGCSIYLRPDGQPGVFVGSTDEQSCGSTLRGASYATSEVTIEPGLLISWDRGWDSAGGQVWGATEGGYEFVKISGTAP